MIKPFYILAFYVLLAVDKPNIALSNFVLKAPHVVIFFVCIIFTYTMYKRAITINNKNAYLYYMACTLYTVSVFVNFTPRGFLSVLILAGLGPLIFYSKLAAYSTASQGLVDLKSLIKLSKNVLRLVSFVMILQVILGIPRPSFFLYEPSYLAIFLLPILYITYITKFNLETITHYFVILILSQSFLLFIFISAFTVITIFRLRIKSVAYFLAALCTLLFLKNFVPRLESAFSVLQNASGNIAGWTTKILILIGGNRLERSIEAWITFKENPFFGVGVGKTGDYFVGKYGSNFRFFEISSIDYVPGGVTNNMVLQLLSEVGLVGSISILLILAMQISNLLRCGTKASIAFVVCVIITLIMESTILRLYFICGILFVGHFHSFTRAAKKLERTYE